MTAQPVESLFRIIDNAKEIKFGVARITALKQETNVVGRNRMPEFGGQLSRNARVECIVYRGSIDEETITEENKFCGGLGFEKGGLEARL